MNQQRNMVLAFVLSMLVLLGWNALFPQPQTDSALTTTKHTTAQQEKHDSSGITPDGGAKDAPAPAEGRDTAQLEGGIPEHADAQAASNGAHRKHFTLANDVIELEVDDRGWLVRATLRQYRESVDPASPLVSVLGANGKHRMFLNSGILGARMDAPFAVIKRSGRELRMQARMDRGRVWVRTIRLEPGSYRISIEDRIVGGAGVKLYRQVVEKNPDRQKNTFYEHVGPIALIQDKLTEVDYDDLDEKGSIRTASTGGWIGIMNRYFIAALIADKGRDYPFYFKGNGLTYQAGLIDDGRVDGKDQIFEASVFIGPKSIPLLKTLDVGLERSVDFGYFAFIAKPLHALLLWLHDHVVANFGWDIILLVLMIKILFYWPTQKSYESMAAMRKLQPELARLKDLYGDDRQRMSQEMMELYRKHKVNPLGGCLPIMVQIPVFFALYKVLLMSIEMRQAPFIGWIHDLSVQDPYFVLPVLMGLSMFVQQKLNPQPTDPMQAKVMQFLPPIFTVMFLFFPAGLVLYWLVNNILSIAQQWYVLKVKKAL